MTQEKIASDSPHSEATRATLRRLVGLIIPASAAHGVPGADDDEIFADVLRTGAGYAEVLAEAAAFVNTIAGGEFLDLDESTQVAAAGEFYRSPRPSARTVLSLLAQCYYRDDRVMRSIGMEARAPHPRGFELTPGDWSLLDPVRARGRVYKDV